MIDGALPRIRAPREPLRPRAIEFETFDISARWQLVWPKRPGDSAQLMASPHRFPDFRGTELEAGGGGGRSQWDLANRDPLRRAVDIDREHVHHRVFFAMARGVVDRRRSVSGRCGESADQRGHVSSLDPNASTSSWSHRPARRMKPESRFVHRRRGLHLPGLELTPGAIPGGATICPLCGGVRDGANIAGGTRQSRQRRRAIEFAGARTHHPSVSDDWYDLTDGQASR